MFRRKQARLKRYDIRKRIAAVREADRLSAKSGKKLFVIKMACADYRIFAKSELKTVGRKLNINMGVNYYQVNEYIVHIARRKE